MGEITERARDLLFDDDFIQGFYRDDPYSVLEYLKYHPHDSNEDEDSYESNEGNKSFYNKTLANKIHDLLIDVGLLESDGEFSDADESYFADLIYQRMHDIDISLLELKLKTELTELDKQFLVNKGLCDESANDQLYVQYFFNMFLHEDISLISAYAEYVLTEQIKRNLIECGRCDANSSNTEFAMALTQLFLNQTESTLRKIYVRNPWRKIISRSTPIKWLNGKSKGIKSRDEAIKLCFALNADYSITKSFLNKCGFALLHPRNALDATYIYCLINNRSYVDAQKIIRKYKDANPIKETYNLEKNRKPITEINPSFGTTHILINDLLDNSSWDNDKEFLDTFLIPKTDMFMSYSKTALMEYYKLKNPLYFAILQARLESEEEEYKEYLKGKKTGLDTSGLKSDVQVSINFCNYLKNHRNDNDLLNHAYSLLNTKVKKVDGKYQASNNTFEVCISIQLALKHYENDLLIQKSVSDLLTKSVTPYRFYSEELPCIADKEEGTDDNRQRSISQSEFSNTVLKKFPYRQFVTKFEKNPDDYYDDFSVRNMIILLFFLKYSSDWASIEYDTEGIFGLVPFLHALNGNPEDPDDQKREGLLGKCGLGFIYPPNRFDWLICFCIRKYELLEPYERIGDKASELFQEVLAASFGDSV